VESDKHKIETLFFLKCYQDYSILEDTMDGTYTVIQKELNTFKYLLILKVI